MKLLHLDSSALGANSVTRELTAADRRPLAGRALPACRSSTATWTPIRSRT